MIDEDEKSSFGAKKRKEKPREESKQKTFDDKSDKRQFFKSNNGRSAANDARSLSDMSHLKD